MAKGTALYAPKSGEQVGVLLGDVTVSDEGGDGDRHRVRVYTLPWGFVEAHVTKEAMAQAVDDKKKEAARRKRVTLVAHKASPGLADPKVGFEVQRGSIAKCIEGAEGASKILTGELKIVVAVGKGGAHEKTVASGAIVDKNPALKACLEKEVRVRGTAPAGAAPAPGEVPRASEDGASCLDCGEPRTRQREDARTPRNLRART